MPYHLCLCMLPAVLAITVITCPVRAEASSAIPTKRSSIRRASVQIRPRCWSSCALDRVATPPGYSVPQYGAPPDTFDLVAVSNGPPFSASSGTIKAERPTPQGWVIGA